MEAIENFSEVVRLLKDKEIVYSVERNRITYYFVRGSLLTIKSDSVHYQLEMDDFIKDFNKLTFYLYTDKQDIVDESKDEAYYSWKAKGTN